MEMNYEVRSVAISSDGSYIAVAAVRVSFYPMAELYDGYIYLFSSNSSTPIWSYYTPPNRYSCPHSVSISLDGSRIFTPDGMLLFSRSDNTPLNIQGPGGSVQFRLAAMSADGRYIACGGGNSDYYTGYVGLLSADNGASLWGYNTSTGSSSSYGITSIAISADGNYIAATEEFEQDCFTLHGLYLFSSSSGTPIWEYVGSVNGWNYTDPGYLTVAGISSDGGYILFASRGRGLLPLLFLQEIVLYEREAALSSTNLAVSPSSFSISPGSTITLTATLTSEGAPLADRTIVWTTTAGDISPLSGITDSQGRMTIAYAAPSSWGNVTITASFEGDAQYAASSGSATGVITATSAPNPQPSATSIPSSEHFPYWLLLAVVILVLLVGSVTYLAGRRMSRRSSATTRSADTPNVSSIQIAGGW
jgi:outer membrane protein assembly factor BamB